MNNVRLCVVGGAAVLLLCSISGSARPQEPPPPPSASSQTPQNPSPTPNSPSSSSSKGRKYSHANDFLIRGTVFTPDARAFPAVQLRVRRANETKFRWQTYTNSRGEFAVRVPQGLQYELVIHAKGFADQTRTIDATSGISEDNVVFRMAAIDGGKTGGKK
jgi:Carboxypeptidase regulatory-like domain